MKYVIDEEELVNLLGEMLDDKYNDPCDCADNFLRLKQPIELIVEGKVKWIVKLGKAWWQIGDTPLFKIGNKFKNVNKLDGKSISIYVEVNG